MTTGRLHPCAVSTGGTTAAARNITTARLSFDAFTIGDHQLQLIAYGGADILNQKNVVFSPPELQFEPGPAPSWARTGPTASGRRGTPSRRPAGRSWWCGIGPTRTAITG